MAAAGSRSRVTTCWLLSEDERAVGDAISEALPDGRWRCSQPGPLGLHELHLHVDITDAMACGGTQAFLPLPAGASLPATVIASAGVPTPTGPPGAATLQLLQSRIAEDSFGRYFEAGRLAIRWYEHTVAPETHRLLVDQTALAWTALRRLTLPARIQDTHGRLTGGMRVGVRAKAFISEQKIPLRRSGLTEYTLT